MFNTETFWEEELQTTELIYPVESQRNLAFEETISKIKSLK